jgi:hypothetical protein
VVSSVNSSGWPVLVPRCAEVAFKRTSCATMFVFTNGLGGAGCASTGSRSIGCSSGGCTSGCGSEGLAGGESVKGRMSSAKDNSVVPYTGIASDPERKSRYEESSAKRTVQTLLLLSQPEHTIEYGANGRRSVSSTASFARRSWIVTELPQN